MSWSWSKAASSDAHGPSWTGLNRLWDRFGRFETGPQTEPGPAIEGGAGSVPDRAEPVRDRSLDTQLGGPFGAHFELFLRGIPRI